jgi:hypothetical protein
MHETDIGYEATKLHFENPNTGKYVVQTTN